jgi:hypothetical protein
MATTSRNASWVIVAGIVVAWGVSSAYGADRFVATTGTDGLNDCTASSAPCRTVGYAVGQASAGDEIKVGHGVYVEQLMIAAPAMLTVTGGWADGFGSRDLKEHATSLSRGSILVAPSGDDSVEVDFDGLRFPKNPVNADGEGGGTTQIVVSDCLFSGLGGLGGEQVHGAGTIVLHATRTTFKGVRRGPTSCGHCGGGVAAGADSGTVTVIVDESTFVHDQGGIDVETDLSGTGSLSVTASTFDHCKSKGIGAIYVLAGSNGTSVTMTNSFITRSSPAGIEFISSENTPSPVVTLVNDTFLRNGFGVVASVMNPPATAEVDLTNVILWKDKTDLDIGGSVVANADHDDFGTVIGTVNDLGGNLAVDPQLLHNGFELASTSPMIDAGTCTGAPATDIEGDPRPTGAGCDIGADEFVP